MFRNKKIMKLIAMSAVLVMVAAMSASCATGSNYADAAGDSENAITVYEKDAVQKVEYTGDPIIKYVDTYVTDDGTSVNGNNSGTNNESNNNNSGTNNESNNNNSGTNNESNNNNSGSESNNNSDTNNGSDDDVDTNEELANDTSGTPITMMTQNLRVNSLNGTGDGDNNTIALRQYRFRWLVDKYDPDVIAAQECGEAWINILTGDLFSDYVVEYKYRAESNHESTPVMYKKSKYDRLDGGYFWLSETPDVSSPSYGETGVVARVCSWVTLKDKSTGQKFNFYSTHFPLGGGQTATKAGLQLQQLFKNLPSNTYAFVLGDFNLNYQGAEYNGFVDWQNIIELRELAHLASDEGLCDLSIGSGTMNGFSNPTGGNSYIDFIMTKPQAHMAIDSFTVCYDQPAVADKNVDAGYVSDHFAVVAKVRIGTTPSYAEVYGY